MVLVRRRTAFVEDLIRELKGRNIDVAGIDRMVLTEQLAVQERMLAYLEALIQRKEGIMPYDVEIIVKGGGIIEGKL